MTKGYYIFKGGAMMVQIAKYIIFWAKQKKKILGKQAKKKRENLLGVLLCKIFAW